MPMGLNRKPSPARPEASPAYDYPDELLPPLPESVKTRLPELEEWATKVSENYRSLVLVLLRRDREVARAIEVVKESIP